MGRRHRKFKLHLKSETALSLLSILFFLLGALQLLSFSNQGYLLTQLNGWLKVYFGLSLLIVPFMFLAAGLMLMRTKWKWTQPHVLLGALVTFVGCMGLFRTGIIGQAVSVNIADLISFPGGVVLYLLMILAGILIIVQLSLKEVFELIGKLFNRKSATSVDDDTIDDATVDESSHHRFSLPKLSLPFKKAEDDSDRDEESDQDPDSEAVQAKTQKAVGSHLSVMAVTAPVVAAAGTAVVKPKSLAMDPNQNQVVWEYPPLSLLSDADGGEANRGDVNKNADIIEATLRSFNIKVKVAGVNRGPSVTQYALNITEGTKLSRITALSTDLALALAAPTGQIRIEAPIAGTSLVGVEVPNYTASYVTLRKMLSMPEMKKNTSKLATALGINVNDKPVVMDIAKMPHVLIAGATGSGKSVAVNAFLCSILFRASPAEVRLILVDPKRVELDPYNNIPHLLVPVINDPKKVVSALKWATNEMEHRYELLSQAKVKSIDLYNEVAGYSAMFRIVIIIDELADIMLFAPAEVEESVTRIAQMARAVGIHLVLATQRPSVDVITGLIKANIPARIAFNVSSMMDSRVILDTPGAEKLLGRGDMLYIPPELSKPVRIQGTYVTEKEIKAVVDFVKSQGEQPHYEEEITTKYKVAAKGGMVEEGSKERDELYDEVAQFLATTGRASASVVQRKFGLGYNRSARIMDQLYAAGMIGPSDGSKAREVYTSRIMENIRAQETGEVE